MADTVVFEGDTAMQHYQVIDTMYEGRPARVLFSGRRGAAQSGIAKDDKPELLFDYNQRFMELVSRLNPRRVLLIGGGAYTLPMALLKSFPGLQIDVVELDPELDAIASRYFGLKSNKRLHIYHGDGRYYLEQSLERYDLIFIDAFTHTSVPESLIDDEVPGIIYQRLQANGVVAVNIISPYMGPNAGLIHDQYANYHNVFAGVAVHPAGRTLFTLHLPQNLVLVAKKNRDTPIELRYGALDVIQ